MEKYVISLTTATDRRQHIISEFGKQGIEFEFFDAVTPKTLQNAANFLKIDLTKHIGLTDNELSCLCSQVALWKKAIDEQLDYIAIFEDDVYLSNTAHQFLGDGGWIPSHCDFIKLEKTLDKVRLVNPQPVMDHKLAQLTSHHFGTGGYILSQKAANILYHHFLSLPMIDHIDQYLFKTVLDDKILPIYQLNPVLCIQDCILYPNNQKFSSCLEWRDNQTKDKLTPTQKLMRELKRPFQQLKGQLQQTSLEFKQ